MLVFWWALNNTKRVLWIDVQVKLRIRVLHKCEGCIYLQRLWLGTNGECSSQVWFGWIIMVMVVVVVVVMNAPPSGIILGVK